MKEKRGRLVGEEGKGATEVFFPIAPMKESEGERESRQGKKGGRRSWWRENKKRKEGWQRMYFHRSTKNVAVEESKERRKKFLLCSANEKDKESV